MAMLVVAFLSAGMSLLLTVVVERFVAPVSALDGFAQLRISENAGIAFGLTFPPFLQAIFILTALLCILVFAARSKPNCLGTIAFGLIIGGATANLVDRIGDGLVTDYIAIGLFPVFNGADACITVGAGLLILHSLKERNTASLRQ